MGHYFLGGLTQGMAQGKQTSLDNAQKQQQMEIQKELFDFQRKKSKLEIDEAQKQMEFEALLSPEEQKQIKMNKAGIKPPSFEEKLLQMLAPALGQPGQPAQQGQPGQAQPPASLAGPKDPILGELADYWAKYNGIDPAVFKNVVGAESGWNPGATNKNTNGTIDAGLGQVNQSNWGKYNLQNPLDPSANLQTSAQILKENLARFGGDQQKAVAAYQMGPDAVAAKGPHGTTYEKVFGRPSLQQFAQNQQTVGGFTANDLVRGLIKKTTGAEVNDKREEMVLPNGSKVKVRIDPDTHQPILDDALPQAGTGAENDQKYLDIMTRKNQGETTTKAEDAFASSYEKLKTMSAASFGAVRGDIMQRTVIDTKNGNALRYATANEINEVNASEPGRFIPAGEGTKALNKTALIEDINGAIANTRQSMDKAIATPFSTAQLASLAYITKSSDPASAWQTFWKSEMASTLSPDQIDYLTDIAQLHENAMAMRSVLGAGQGSDDVRRAIRDTIPGMLTPGPLAAAQLDKFEQQMARLARGVPTVPLKGENPSGQAKPKPPPSTADSYLKSIGR
jgi:hypothetical protein